MKTKTYRTGHYIGCLQEVEKIANRMELDFISKRKQGWFTITCSEEIEENSYFRGLLRPRVVEVESEIIGLEGVAL